jgi:predicted ATP-dependent protease
MIGELAKEVLEKVRREQMTKLAQHQIVKTAGAAPKGNTELTLQLVKLAEMLKQAEDDVTVADLKRFIEETK